MTQLDRAELREYAARDWGAPERLARRERARQPVEVKVALAIDLYEATRATKPGWPDTATRREDFDAHLRLCAMLRAAGHVGSR